LDDNRIVDLYFSRDKAAILETSKKYGSRLRNVAYGIVENLPTAEECENDTMVLCEAINTFLATLGDEKRNIFMRRYWYMDSIAAISKRYGLSQSKVKSILFRSRNQLREYLDKEGYDL